MSGPIRLRVASYNLENFDRAASDLPRFEARLGALRPRLRELAADILCLQEVNGQKVAGRRRLQALEALCATTAYEHFHIASTRRLAGGEVYDIHNLVILSRWPIATLAQYRHDLVPPPSYRPVTASPRPSAAAEVCWDRPILHAVIDHPAGRRLHLVNLHLRAPLASPIAGQKTGPFTWRSLGAWAEGFYLAAIKRSGQALELRLLVEQIFADEPAAMIAVCGDYNAELSEMPLKIAMGELEDIDDPALPARQLLAVERELALAGEFTLLHAGKRFMPDHILVSRPLFACLDHVTALNHDLPDEILIAESDPRSRHAPLLAEFDLSKAS
jgi:endonuclease/exonuclease/phosphatase family metal-dependent hydrolase